MLTERQYEIIGRLSFAFNELEYSVEVWLANLLAIPESYAAVTLAGEGTFHSKVLRFKSVLTAFAEQRPELSDDINAVMKVLTEAEDVASKRNYYVHASVRVDSVTQQVALWTKKKGAWGIGSAEPLDEAKVRSGIERAERLVRELDETSGKLFSSLDEQRKLKPRV